MKLPSESRILAGGSKHSLDLSPIVANIPPVFSVVLMSDEAQHKSQTCGRFFSPGTMRSEYLKSCCS